MLENITDKATQFYTSLCQKEEQKTQEQRAHRPANHQYGMDDLVQDSFASLQVIIVQHQRGNRKYLEFDPPDDSFYLVLVGGKNTGEEDGYDYGDEFDTNNPLDDPDYEGYD